MSTQIPYKQAQANLDELCNQVAENRDSVLIERHGGKNVALIAADELSSMEETIYLFGSPANATRLHAAIEQAKAHAVKPQTVDELFEELQLDE